MEATKTRGKIISTLRDRRCIEETIRRLACISGSAEAEWEARRVADMGDQVIPALVGLLDTSDPRLLGAIGLVATCLDHKEIALALRDVAIWSDRSDRARISALLIMEKFLDEEMDDSLYQGLESPETVVAQSLVEMTEHAIHDRGILHEYVRATEQQPDDVIELIVDITFDLGPERAVMPFWALAQSKRQDVAESALHCMGSLRSPDSGIMLQALLPTLAPARHALVERSLRKLRFSSVDVPPLPSPHPAWRALISPVDGQGSQSIWFALDPQQDAPTRVLSVLVNDLAGVQGAAWDRNGELAKYLPPKQSLGTVHHVALPGASTALSLLETTFDTGRRLVQEALAINHAKDQVPPLGYAVLSDTLWKWKGNQLAERPSIEQPSEAEVVALCSRTADLLSHPAFETWFVQGEAVLNVARRFGLWTLFHGPPGKNPMVNDLIRHHFSTEGIARYRRRLERTAEWLWLAGEKETARLALVAALTLKESAPENHPLAQRMVQVGLAFAIQSLALDPNQQ